jgi:hypothetical protein
MLPLSTLLATRLVRAPRSCSQAKGGHERYAAGTIASHQGVGHQGNAAPPTTHLLLLGQQLRDAGLRAVSHGGGQLLKHVRDLWTRVRVRGDVSSSSTASAARTRPAPTCPV